MLRNDCISSFSRRIIWLELLTTNNDPNVILLSYLLAILRNNGTCLDVGVHRCKFMHMSLSIGCPSIVRSDCGTENTSLAVIHMALRHSHTDEFKGEKRFRFGSSTTNTVRVHNKHCMSPHPCKHAVIQSRSQHLQRIEGWWAQLRNSVTDWWINVFKDLIQDGDFNPHNETHR